MKVEIIKCIPEQAVYASYPPKYRCIVCNGFWLCCDEIPNCKPKEPDTMKTTKEIKKYIKKEYQSFLINKHTDLINKHTETLELIANKKNLTLEGCRLLAKQAIEQAERE